MLYTRPTSTPSTTLKRRQWLQLAGAAVTMVERCSGHGGVWGARSANFDVAVKVGKPAAQAALDRVVDRLEQEARNA